MPFYREQYMPTFVICHGAWSSGWAWKKMRPLMRAAGHELITPSCTGLGERSHLAHPGINLDSHIQDLLQVLEFEDLRDVVLLGHSYGGMVATGVADRAASRIRQLVYLDAFVPRHGESAMSLQPPAVQNRMAQLVRSQGEGWRVPANPLPPDTAADDVAWANPRRVMQPLKCFEQPITLTGAAEDLPRAYIYCTRSGPGDVFRQFADRVKNAAGWCYTEMDASHNPHITCPVALMQVLEGLLQ
jgi:pimeloyl-ACP methyl ester carboxylesterase